MSSEQKPEGDEKARKADSMQTGQQIERSLGRGSLLLSKNSKGTSAAKQSGWGKKVGEKSLRVAESDHIVPCDPSFEGLAFLSSEMEIH